MLEVEEEDRTVLKTPREMIMEERKVLIIYKFLKPYSQFGF